MRVVPPFGQLCVVFLMFGRVCIKELLLMCSRFLTAVLFLLVLPSSSFSSLEVLLTSVVLSALHLLLPWCEQVDAFLL